MGDMFADRREPRAGAPVMRPRVSSHAIVRYCQRVLNVRLDQNLTLGVITESALARLHVVAAGRSRRSDIVAEILSPAVCTAISAGFTTFGTGRFVVYVSETGTIKTIAPPYPKYRGKVRFRTRGEDDARLHRIDRRDRLAGDHE